MPAAMPSPWKHPKTGVFWLRRRVPADIRQIVGKAEEKLSLRTKELAVAKPRFVRALAESDARWAKVRSSLKGAGGLVGHAETPAAAKRLKLTERDAHEIAAFSYDQWLARHWDNPSAQTVFPLESYDELWNERSFLKAGRTANDVELASAAKHSRVRDQCFAEADDLLFVNDLAVDPVSREALARAVSAQWQRAALLLRRITRGEHEQAASGRPGSASPFWTRISEPPAAMAVKAVRFSDLITGWNAEKQPVPKTVYEWTRVLKQLQSFIGHDDAARLSADDLLRWKSALIDQGLAAKTIRDAKLTPVRAILRWAVDNRRLSVNVADGIKLELKRRAGETIRGFTDDEAKLLLSAATQESDPVRRWVPWLCAYSGARLSEVCQLRVRDIAEISGVWSMRITADAGSLKNASSERLIPLHSALIEAGFLGFAKAAMTEELFSGLPPDKFGKRGGNGTKVLGRWVRRLGLTDERLPPNHSWRHRFKTLARRHGMALDVTDAINGHKPRTIGADYGEYELKTMKQEIEKIPKHSA